MRYSSGELVGLYSFPASPRSLLLIDDGHWYSADAGVSWQLIADSSEYSLLISPYEPLTVLRIKQGRLAILDLHGPGTDPRAPVAPPAAGLTGYNAISRHQLSPRFEAGWEAHGGQRWLGPPISEEFVELNAVDDRPVLVQYFMRGRLEYRPTPSGQAVPGAIGSELVAPRLAVREPAFLPVANPRDPTARYVAATGHTLRGPFLRFWEEPGVQQRLGNPISEPVIVTIADWTGLVQYFERARLDMRGGQVHVGSLGVELLVLRYGMP
jgi:hypothetical protein